MKLPSPPPDWRELVRGKKAVNLIGALVSRDLSTPNDAKYLHWDQLRHRKPPENLNTTDWWSLLKIERNTRRKAIPLKDAENRPFSYVSTESLAKELHQLDRRAGGLIQMPEPVTNPDTKDQYLISSLIEEAITSSQLEGAATTHRVAEEMIRSGRPPRDQSERMILNNFLTMQRITDLKDKALSSELVLELHRLVTADTLDGATTGRLRRKDEQLVVGDDVGTVFHVPPPAEQLEGRMRAMCEFANGETPAEFLHPVVRAMILHFWLAYDHPFVDGNGRTARALFYWCMLHEGYWLFEFISISEIILKAPAKYGRAFLYTESDENDLTYFLHYHMDVIRRAIDQLYSYVKRKTADLQALERELRGAAELNHRQQAIVSHALRHPHQRYTIESHRRSHNVVYQTARTDMLNLVDRGLFEKRKVGKEWVFTSTENLEQRLRQTP